VKAVKELEEISQKTRTVLTVTSPERGDLAGERPGRRENRASV